MGGEGNGGRWEGRGEEREGLPPLEWRTGYTPTFAYHILFIF